jgi:hypothetical protein
VPDRAIYMLHDVPPEVAAQEMAYEFAGWPQIPDHGGDGSG